MMLIFKKPKKNEVFVNNLLELGQWLSAAVVVTGVICEVIYKADRYLFVITLGVFLWAVVQKLKHPSRRSS